jgi:hypothetical protein
VSRAEEVVAFVLQYVCHDGDFVADLQNPVFKAL